MACKEGEGSRFGEGGSGPRNNERGLWKKVWGACVPGKVKILGWQGCLNSLPTRSKLVEQKIVTDNMCLFCASKLETIEHVLVGLARTVTKATFE